LNIILSKELFDGTDIAWKNIPRLHNYILKCRTTRRKVTAPLPSYSTSASPTRCVGTFGKTKGVSKVFLLETMQRFQTFSEMIDGFWF